MTSEIEPDIDAINAVRAKFVTWARDHAALDDPLVVAMALFDLTQKVLIQALGDRKAALAILRRALDDNK